VSIGIADLTPANVLWDGYACRLVDFEDGGLTDPAYELADHVEHLAGRLDGIYDPNALIEAVGLSAKERDRTRSYRPLWAAFWLAMQLPGNGGFARNPPGTTEAQAQHVLALLD
jgi:thiamine kinase-like enzyme